MDNATVWAPLNAVPVVPVPNPAPTSHDTAVLVAQLNLLLAELNVIAARTSEINKRQDATNIRLDRLMQRNY